MNVGVKGEKCFKLGSLWQLSDMQENAPADCMGAMDICRDRPHKLSVGGPRTLSVFRLQCPEFQSLNRILQDVKCYLKFFLATF